MRYVIDQNAIGNSNFQQNLNYSCSSSSYPVNFIKYLLKSINRSIYVNQNHIIA